jgi:hypothetical protein
MDLIPGEIFREILFYLPASVINKECTINKYFDQYCNDWSSGSANFLEEYVKLRYNIDELVQWNHTDIDKWNYLMNRASKTFNTLPSWRMLALWLEESKVVRIKTIRMGTINIPISGYEKIGAYNEIDANPFIIENVRGNYVFVVYGDTTFDLDYLPHINNETRIRDINIKTVGNILNKIVSAEEYTYKSLWY